MKKSTEMKKVLALFLAGVLTFSMMGCSGNKASEDVAKATAKATAEATAEAEDTVSDLELQAQNAIKGATVDLSRVSVDHLENKTGEEIKMACLVVPQGTFWLELISGMASAGAALADENVTLDFYTFNDGVLDADEHANIIDTLVLKDYDVIQLLGFSDAMVPAMKAAMNEGVMVTTFNTDITIDQDDARLVFVGQDLYAAGECLADLIAEQIGGKGKVACISGDFSMSSHEARRNGFYDRMAKAYPDIEVLEAVECKNDEDTAYDQTMDLLNAHRDLAAIACLATGQIGCGRALNDAGVAGKVKMCGFDYQDEVVDMIHDGTMQATIAQGPFNQGCWPLIFAYNTIVNGGKPLEGESGFVPTAMDVLTDKNIDEYLKKIGYVYGSEGK